MQSARLDYLRRFACDSESLLKLSVHQAFELACLSGQEVAVLVTSESGHVYSFSTPKFSQLTRGSEVRESFV